MKETVGDLFDYVGSHWIVVTTNQGWKLTGENIMGAGVAKRAAEICPELPRRYGEFCRAHPGAEALASYEIPDGDGNWRGFIMFPTKPLNPAAPHLSWKTKSSLPLITKGLEMLSNFGAVAEKPIALPLPGTANGGLNPDDVLPVVREHLVSDNFVLVLREQVLW